MTHFECEQLFENSFHFWDKLTEAQRDLLCRNTISVLYKKGQNVHGVGGECTGAIFVKRGTLRVYMLSEDGREITLYRLYENDICMLSASCVIKSITFDVSVDAEEDSDCYIINSSTFAKLSDENIYVENFALRMATERFSNVMWTMQQMLFTSFDKRLAGFLLSELDKNDGDTISLTHEQIAKYVGSAREVVSRMLKYFSSEKLVSVSRGGVKILDKDGLKKLIK